MCTYCFEAHRKFRPKCTLSYNINPYTSKKKKKLYKITNQKGEKRQQKKIR